MHVVLCDILSELIVAVDPPNVFCEVQQLFPSSLFSPFHKTKKKKIERLLALLSLLPFLLTLFVSLFLSSDPFFSFFFSSSSLVFFFLQFQQEEEKKKTKVLGKISDSQVSTPKKLQNKGKQKEVNTKQIPTKLQPNSKKKKTKLKENKKSKHPARKQARRK